VVFLCLNDVIYRGELLLINMYGIVYKTINLINGKEYVGQTKKINNYNYLGSGLHLKRAVKKEGKLNFKRTKLCECFSKKELDEAERFYIELYDTINNGYNIASGGQGGAIPRSEKEKKRMRENNPAKRPEVRKKISESLKRVGFSKNRTWVVNIYDEELYISKQFLNFYIFCGWKRGRKSKIGKITSEVRNKEQENPTKNRIWITKEGKNKRVKKEDLKEYLNNGWKTGVISSRSISYSINEVVELLNSGLKYVDISKKLGTTKGSIKKILGEFFSKEEILKLGGYLKSRSKKVKISLNEGISYEQI